MALPNQSGREEESGKEQIQKQQKARAQADQGKGGGGDKKAKEISEAELIESTHWGEGSTGEDFGRSQL